MIIHERADFLDYSKFRDIRLAQYNLIVFCGNSGSGKSTAIEILVNIHCEHFTFVFVDISIIGTPDVVAKYCVASSNTYLIIDEIWKPSQLHNLRVLSRRGYKIIVASHVSPWVSKLLLMYSRSLTINLDACNNKLERYLDHRGISYSKAVMRSYQNKYGNVFTELQIILVHCPSKNLDYSYAKFHKFNRITKAVSRR